VISARGAGALLYSSLYRNAEAQTDGSLDTFVDDQMTLDPGFPTILDRSLELVTRAGADQSTLEKELKLPELYRRTLDGGMGAALASSAAAIALLGPAGSLLTVPAIIDVVSVLMPPGTDVLALLAAYSVPALLPGVMITANVLLEDVVQEPLGTKSYLSAITRMMGTPWWAFNGGASATISDRAALTALSSLEVAQIWSDSFPRSAPNDTSRPDANLVAVMFARITEILCGRLSEPSVSAPDALNQLIDAIIAEESEDQLTLADPHLYRVVDHYVTSWAALCMALAVRPNFDFAPYESTATMTLASASFVGNARTKELHVSHCEWAQRVAPYNRVWFERLGAALVADYEGCRFCLPHLDRR
jgi:hypothetical protein